MSRTGLPALILSVVLGSAVVQADIWIPAFPGGEGFGAKTLGGRGGTVIEVTNLNGCYNIILDHCSMSWAVDENFSSWGDPRDFTIQWCLISEGLRNSVHSKGAHSMGALIGSEGCERVSFHHNLLAHNVDRNPRFKTTGVVDCVNNVIYNHGDTVGVFSADYANMPVNYVGNYVKLGPSSSGNYEVAMWESGGRACSVYVEGNIGPHRPDETVPNITLQPASVLGRRGQQATFTAQAAGAGLLSYQWQRDGVDLLNGPRRSGAHAPTLTISDLSFPDAGRYRLVVSDGVAWESRMKRC